jgi:hypothetical protein
VKGKEAIISSQKLFQNMESGLKTNNTPKDTTKQESFKQNISLLNQKI